MLNYMLVILILLLNFIFQSTILQHFKVLGVVPNTALILVVIYGILKGKYKGAFIGLAAGLVQDIFFGGPIGLNALIYFSIGYTSGLLDDKVFKENLALPFLTIIISTVAYHGMYYLFMLFLSKDASFISMIKDILLIEMVYNSVLAIFLYKKILKHYRAPSIKFTKKIR